MLAHKMKIDKLNTQQKLETIVEQLKEIYCDLKISGHPELQNMSSRWRRIFAWKHCLDREVNSIEISNILKKYAITLAWEYWVEVNDILKELTKKQNNLYENYKKRLLNYLEAKNGIITRTAIDAILTGNYSALWNEVTQIETKFEERVAQKKEKDEWLNRLKNIRNEQRATILAQKDTSSKKKGFDPEITKKSHSTLQFERIADNLLDDPDIIIERPDDLNNYYDNSSWIDNSKENLEEIFTLYCARKLYLDRNNLTIKLIREIYKLWEQSKADNIQFLNNQHAWKYIKDSLAKKWYKLDKNVNTEFIKIFYAWVTQKKSTYWL